MDANRNEAELHDLLEASPTGAECVLHGLEADGFRREIRFRADDFFDDPQDRARFVGAIERVIDS